MTDLERQILDCTKNEDFLQNLQKTVEEIQNNSEFKKMDVADKAAIMAVISLRASLATEDKLNQETEVKALWRFIRYLTEIQMPLRFTDFTYLLFPGNEKYFANILTPTAFNIIQRQAAAMLKNENYENEEHKAHLEKIVGGQMPYGYSLEMPSIKEEEEDEKQD